MYAGSIFLQPILAAKKTVINSCRKFFPSKRQLSIFFNFHFSSVHFIGVFYRGDLLNLPKFYRASSVSWRAPTGKWQWLTDQSERAIYFCYVIIYIMTLTALL